ncbi:MAG TPA: L-serine ammonia-lyase, iron-sulfur-dependent, subunit alpha [Candidatus Sumerlaeota bacterium]|nr:L-serine ammonia-lyase, iron-sulfur-dependent, subunit alpha [Candidatus Sumerlaeota bacterium]
MLTSEFQSILQLLKDEVAPALGCTEPIAVALGCARAAETLGRPPESITVHVSPNIFKNGMGVGVPHTSLKGLPIAAALGALGGKSDAQLEVLKAIEPDTARRAEALVRTGRVQVHVQENAGTLYIESVCCAGADTARVVIRDRHTHIESVELNNQVLLHKELDKKPSSRASSQHPVQALNTDRIYAFATEVDLAEVEFLYEGAEMNRIAAEEGFRGDYGLRVGKTLASSPILRDDPMTHAMSLTAAGVDARMSGCGLPVMSNSGSGNQGLTATLPVLAMAECQGSSRERLLRALVLSNLLAIHTKTALGRLSALCGCVVAAAGAACGITYLLGGALREIKSAMNNMIANVSGMICDGAKEGCALKVATGVSAAVQAAILAQAGVTASANDGIIDNDVERTILNLATVGSKGMTETDRLILEIMVQK